MKTQFKTDSASRGEIEKRLWLPFLGFYGSYFLENIQEKQATDSDFDTKKYLADFSQCYVDCINQILSDTFNAQVSMTDIDYNVPSQTNLTDGINAVVDVMTLPSLGDLQEKSKALDIDFKANLIDYCLDADKDNDIESWFDVKFENWPPRQLEALLVVMVRVAKLDNQVSNDPLNDTVADLVSFESDYFYEYLSANGLMLVIDY